VRRRTLVVTTIGVAVVVLAAAGIVVATSGDDSPAAEAGRRSDPARTPATSPGASPTTSTTAGIGPNGCPAAYRFPDLAATEGAGPGYDRPQVSASCTPTALTMRSNGMISYRFTPTTPNPLRAQSFEWTITLTPERAATPTSIENRLGTLGFTVTGIPIFGPTEGPVPPAQAFGDPVHNGILDACTGHTGPAAEYHYHAITATAACALDERIVGFALDGFPIYSNPQGRYRSGYQRIGDPTSQVWRAYTWQAGDATTLDACNGTTVDGTYRYYATATFPYIIGCFTGTPAAVSGAAAEPMPRMARPAAAVTVAATTAATTAEPTTAYCDLT
jgi:hypothetical protein